MSKPAQNTSPQPDSLQLSSLQLTHFQDGSPRMVDVSEKTASVRSATAEAWLMLPPEARAALEQNPKGDPLSVAQLGGIQAAKRTSELVLLCHPLPLSGVKVSVTLEQAGLRFEATVKTTAPTGVEMEALSAVTVAALNAYDMLKAASQSMSIEGVRLLKKSGGKSDYLAK